MWKSHVLNALQTDLMQIQKRNPRYSLRRYAKKIGLSYGSLSEILSGKRVLSVANAFKILNSIEIDSSYKNLIIALIDSEKRKEVKLLPNEAAKIIENWEYFAVLNVLEITKNQISQEAISSRLGIAPKKLNSILKNLTNWGFASKQQQEYSIISTSWITSDDISSDTIKKSHLQGLKLAKRALAEISVNDRDITSLVFPGNSLQLSRVKKEIRKFMSKMSKLMSNGPLDRVYKFNIQLFPLDKSK